MVQDYKYRHTRLIGCHAKPIVERKTGVEDPVFGGRILSVLTNIVVSAG